MHYIFRSIFQDIVSMDTVIMKIMVSINPAVKLCAVNDNSITCNHKGSSTKRHLLSQTFFPLIASNQLLLCCAVISNHKAQIIFLFARLMCC